MLLGLMVVVETSFKGIALTVTSGSFLIGKMLVSINEHCKPKYFLYTIRLPTNNLLRSDVE